jgi:hypothetical protein
MRPVFTIGFTETTAESFFDRLFGKGVRKVIVFGESKMVTAGMMHQQR